MGKESQTVTSVTGGWGSALKPYFEKESLAAFFVGISSGFPYAMIGATLTTRLAQDGIDKKTVTAFTLSFLVYNLKIFWAWIVDGVRLPVLGRLGQRVSWLIFSGLMVIASVINLALVDPAASIGATVLAAILVGVAGATFDIVIDASGSPRAVHSLLDIAAKGATVVYGAMYPHDFEMPLNLSDYLYLKELTLTGVIISPHTFPRALQILPHLNVDDLTQAVIDLDNAEEAFDVHISGKYPKVVIRCNDFPEGGAA